VTSSWPPRLFVLAAGLGRRLRPLTCVRAKPAVPVAGLPLIVRILARVQSQGIREVVINLHHRPDTIAALVGDGVDLGLAVRYSWEQPVLGSAGGPRRALALLESDPYLMVNGDTLSDVSLRELWEHHLVSNALVTMAVIPNPAPDRYGGVLVDDDGWVTGFSRRGDPRPSFHFIGAQVVAQQVFLPLPDGQPDESVLRVYPHLMQARPRSVKAFITTASFLDIGTVRDYVDTWQAVAAAEAADPWAPGRRLLLHPSTTLTRCLIWNDVTIGAGSTLEDTILTDGVTIPPGSQYARCAIVRADGCRPEPGERVDGDLLIAPFV